MDTVINNNINIIVSKGLLTLTLIVCELTSKSIENLFIHYYICIIYSNALYSAFNKKINKIFILYF